MPVSLPGEGRGKQRLVLGVARLPPHLPQNAETNIGSLYHAYIISTITCHT